MDIRSAIIIGMFILCGFFLNGYMNRYELYVPKGDSNMYLLNRFTGEVKEHYRNPSSSTKMWKMVK